MVKFIYKCRMCGKMYSKIDIETKNAFPVFIHTIKQAKLPDHLQGWDIPMVSYHDCDRNNVGVSDLVGYTEE